METFVATQRHPSLEMPSGFVIKGIHHIEIYVGDLSKTAAYYRSALGFRMMATRASSDRSSVLVGASGVRLVLTTPVHAGSAVAQHLRKHGEGIKDVAFSVSNIDRILSAAREEGVPCAKPNVDQDSPEKAEPAQIAVFGDLVHSLVDGDAEWFPGFVPAAASSSRDEETAIEGIDHVALAVDVGDLDRWTSFYIRALRFHGTHQEDVSTEYSAMRSKVVEAPDGVVRFPIMEPAPGRRKSQIENFIAVHAGPGAQHIAFRTRDIVKSVSEMTTAGVEFLTTPGSYYDHLAARVGDVPMGLETLRRSNILADRDPSGLLLQIFTKPVADRPTLFLELVQRLGAEGFGSGNIKALFEAVERAQAAGNGD